MRTKSYLAGGLIFLFIFMSVTAFAQTYSPSKVIKPIAFDKSEALRDVKIIAPGYRDRSWKEKVIPNEEGFLDMFNSPSSFTGRDPVLQDHISANREAATVGKNFAGVPNLSGLAPPDTDGDVGPDHYFQMVNLAFEIFDKNGNLLYGPADNSTIWDGFTGTWTGTNDGDPIVLYDEYADRWLVSQFALPNYPKGPFYELIAVSATGDPMGAWYRYAYEFYNMPDYPKFGIWPDGYYLTINQFAPRRLNFVGAAVCVVDRNAMLSGDPNAGIQYFNLGTAEGSLLPADADGAAPPAGSPNYLATLYTNGIKFFKAQIDWNTTSNSTLSVMDFITVSPFSYSSITINQPGTSQTLDAMSTRLMYRLQYRNFGNYEVMLTNHTVNVGSGQAGVRWYEFRDSGSGWGLYQEGTFALADGNDRWMGSVAMNGSGDIAVGYSVSGTSTYPSIRIAGQTTGNSGTGILDIDETSIKEGSYSQSGVNRWGDYSIMSVDPSDDNTFWYTQEYSNGGWNWHTQIASFNYGVPVIVAPIADFEGNPTSVAEGGTVSFTDLSQNNPTSWSWSFPGGDPDNSTVENPTVVYPLAGDYSVTLTATNSAGSDDITKTGYIHVFEPTPLPPVADFSSDAVSVTEGGSIQFYDESLNAPNSWSWTFTGGTPATSTAQDPAVVYYTAGIYAVSLTVTNNDGSDTKTIADYITVIPAGGSDYCTSSSTSNALDWIDGVNIGNINNNPSGPGTYSDFTNMTATLAAGSTNPVTLTPHFVSKAQREFWRVWIDFNGDGDFEDADETVLVANNKKDVVTGTISIPSYASGQTRMRISMKNGSSPSSCETFTYGEVEDYTVDFGSAPAVLEKMAEFGIKLYPNPAGSEINVEITSPESAVKLRMYNALGVILDEMNTNERKITLDLSKYGPGIYYIGAENSKETTLKKFIKN